MSQPKSPIATLRERQRRVHRVGDLTTVHLGLMHNLNTRINIQILVLRRHPLQLLPPEQLPPVRIRRAILQRKVQPRTDSGIEDADTVGRHEQDALEVLELLEEDGDEVVLLELVGPAAARLEEHVGLVDQDDGVPDGRVGEQALQLVRDARAPAAELAGGDLEERAFGVLRDELGGERLAAAGGAVEEDDQPFALQGCLVACVVGEAVGGDEGLDDVSLSLGDDESVHRVGSPVNSD